MIEKDEKFINYIKDLKSLNAISAKLELESEYLPENLCDKFQTVLKGCDFPLALKLGGFSSYNDILISKHIKAQTLIAPMIETPYALEKFIETLFSVYSKEELNNKKIYINIETVCAIKNFDEIIKSKQAQYIDGIIIGRGDLISSLKLNPSLIDLTPLKDIISPTIKSAKKEGKKIILGGKITQSAVNFINLFEKNTFYGFETRMIFFKLENFSSDTSIKEAIKKAIEFEIYYLNLLKTAKNQNPNNIEQRILSLQKRLFN